MNAKVPPRSRRRYTRQDFLRVAGAGFAAAAGGGLFAACQESRLARKLHLFPATVKVDEPFAITLRNLSPWQRVTLRARFVDGYDVEWTSRATFRADFRGTVDISRQSPIEGSYTGKDPMGLVWSAKGNGTSYAISLRPQLLSITARTGGETAHAEVARTLLTGEI